jgi:diguanylate cyclase (GGDEF)-like protein/PAS domain S-box-containing protein
MLGWHPDRMIGTRSLEFLHPDDHGRAIASWMEMLARQKPSRARVRHRRGDGGWLWVETENVVVGRDETGDWLIETLISDISEEMAAYEQVRQREELFHRLAESLPTGVMQVDRDRRVVYANSRLSAILAAPAAELLADQIAHLVDADRALLESAIDAALNAGADHDLEVEVHHPQTGDLRRCTAAVVAVAGPEGTNGALVSLDDITDAARMREELRVQATYDALTGCLNRASIIASLDAALAPDRSGLTGVVYLDLDEFKVLNDTFGHAAGDEMLVEVAQRLRGALRDIDRVGRVGGDEFLVVCPGLAEPDQAMSIATRIREHLDRPAALTAGMATPRTSIGVAIGTPGTPVDDLVARADAAMYQSKQQCRGEIVLA